MLMRGDLQKIFDQINPVLNGYNERILALEEALKEAKKAPPKPKTEEKAKKVA